MAVRWVPAHLRCGLFLLRVPGRALAPEWDTSVSLRRGTVFGMDEIKGDPLSRDAEI